MTACSANTDDGARLDIRARDFTGCNFCCSCLLYTEEVSVKQLVDAFDGRKPEQAKKQEYGQHIREVEHAVFIPLSSQLLVV